MACYLLAAVFYGVGGLLSGICTADHLRRVQEEAPPEVAAAAFAAGLLWPLVAVGFVLTGVFLGARLVGVGTVRWWKRLVPKRTRDSLPRAEVVE